MLQIDRKPPMLQREYTPNDAAPASALPWLWGIIRRRLPLILLTMAITIALGLAYVLTAPAKFTATATMVIDPRKAQGFQQQVPVGESSLDAGTVETQVQILKSESLSLAVINELHLASDPEFTGGGRWTARRDNGLRLPLVRLRYV